MATSYGHNHHHHHNVLVIWCVLILSILLMSGCIAETASLQHSNPKALVVAVYKDHDTAQYMITHINHTNPFVKLKLTIDLGGPAFWVDCSKFQNIDTPFYKPVPCGSPQCALTDSIFCHKYPSDTCISIVDNPFFSDHFNGEVALDNVTVPSTNGFNPGKLVTFSNIIYNCGRFHFTINKLASGVRGMAGLGRTKVSLPSQFASALNVPPKFALCLSSYKGALFFGDGPYVFLPGIDVSKSLTYTPLIRNPVPIVSIYGDYPFAGPSYSSYYFIGVTGININNQPVKINTTLLSIDKKGRGGSMISTTETYTVLETSIYKAVVSSFGKALEKVPKVGGVDPFELCFNASSLGSTRVGPGVPTIDLVLNKGAIWKIFGANSMVKASNEALCLGFVDGGENPRTSIVIGGHQLEDNLLQFDLSASRLGFSSSLLFSQTTCANFNFTTSS